MRGSTGASPATWCSPFSRSISSKILAYVFGPMSPVSGSNVCSAHGCSPQSSSLRKIPRYFTEGCPICTVPARTTPNAVPRRSLPTTSARERPGNGSSTVAIRKVSRFPRTSSTSSRPRRTRSSTERLDPSVPTGTTGADGVSGPVTTAGLTPVTRSTSAARSNAAPPPARRPCRTTRLPRVLRPPAGSRQGRWWRRLIGPRPDDRAVRRRNP